MWLIDMRDLLLFLFDVEMLLTFVNELILVVWHHLLVVLPAHDSLLVFEADLFSQVFGLRHLFFNFLPPYALMAHLKRLH